MDLMIIKIDPARPSKHGGFYKRTFFRSMEDNKTYRLDVFDGHKSFKRIKPYLKEQSIFGGFKVLNGEILDGNSNFKYIGEKKMNIYNKIRNWAKERGLYEKGDPKTQMIKLVEEVGELSQGILKEDHKEIIDAIGDCVIVLTNLSHLCGYNIEDCIEKSYDEIKNRTGSMNNGTFVKNE